MEASKEDQGGRGERNKMPTSASPKTTFIYMRKALVPTELGEPHVPTLFRINNFDEIERIRQEIVLGGIGCILREFAPDLLTSYAQISTLTPSRVAFQTDDHGYQSLAPEKKQRVEDGNGILVRRVNLLLQNHPMQTATPHIATQLPLLPAQTSINPYRLSNESNESSKKRRKRKKDSTSPPSINDSDQEPIRHRRKSLKLYGGGNINSENVTTTDQVQVKVELDSPEGDTHLSKHPALTSRTKKNHPHPNDSEQEYIPGRSERKGAESKITSQKRSTPKKKLKIVNSEDEYVPSDTEEGLMRRSLRTPARNLRRQGI